MATLTKISLEAISAAEKEERVEEATPEAPEGVIIEVAVKVADAAKKGVKEILTLRLDPQDPLAPSDPILKQQGPQGLESLPPEDPFSFLSLSQLPLQQRPRKLPKRE